MVIEWVGALIAATAALFDRIEHREEKLQQRTDLLEPLLELYHLVSEWERFAKVTNSKLAPWVHATTPEERAAAQSHFWGVAGLQRARLAEIQRRIGFRVDTDDTIEHRDKLELRDLIDIYAPDLEDQFRHVMRVRVERLRDLQERANIHAPALYAEVEQRNVVRGALEAWADNPLYASIEINEQDLGDFERSGEQLSELRREIASFIRTHWDPKDITF